MTNLCDECPLRGDISDEIIATVSRSNIRAMITKRWGFEFGTAGALVDAKGSISEVLDFNIDPSEISVAALSKRIDSCTQPSQSTGFFNKLIRKGPTCSAIGHLAVTGDTSISPNIAESVRIVLQSDARRAQIMSNFQKQNRSI